MAYVTDANTTATVKKPDQQDFTAQLYLQTFASTYQTFYSGSGSANAKVGYLYDYPTGTIMYRLLPPDLARAHVRLGANVSEDAGSILESTALSAIDSSITESYLPGTVLTEEVAFAELLTPSETSLLYYPKPTNNFDFVDSYQGETRLRRLENNYPKELISSGGR